MKVYSLIVCVDGRNICRFNGDYDGCLREGKKLGSSVDWYIVSSCIGINVGMEVFK
jgi:hypothetical protein